MKTDQKGLNEPNSYQYNFMVRFDYPELIRRIARHGLRVEREKRTANGILQYVLRCEIYSGAVTTRRAALPRPKALIACGLFGPGTPASDFAP
jgi:hypothetical protein